jgi:hypothetical protein
MGKRGELWGTPCSDEKGEKEKPGKHKHVHLSERKEEINFTSHWGIQLFLRL